jgi:putative hydrolase of HD superfamily
VKNIANFLFEAGMLKRTPRTGFQFLGSGAESVAEHIFRTSMIGYTLAQLDEEADAGRVVLLCLFEDLARTLPFGDDYRSLQYEFMAKETREACIAHDADQLEMILALKEYKDLGNRYADEWYPVTLKRLQTDAAKNLAETIWETDSTRWWFDDDTEWWVRGERDDAKP